MGWMISAGKLGKSGVAVSSTPCAGAARWRIIPSADSTASGTTGSTPR
jgi:hypothetical protein